MRVSQSSDKSAVSPQPRSAKAAPAQFGGVPPAYARLHANFGWVVPEQFNIAQVCCARWASRSDATKRIAIHAYSTGAKGQFQAMSELAVAMEISPSPHTDNR